MNGPKRGRPRGLSLFFSSLWLLDCGLSLTNEIEPSLDHFGDQKPLCVCHIVDEFGVGRGFTLNRQLRPVA